MSAIFKDQADAVGLDKLPNIWYLWKALNGSLQDIRN